MKDELIRELNATMVNGHERCIHGFEVYCHYGCGVRKTQETLNSIQRGEKYNMRKTIGGIDVSTQTGKRFQERRTKTVFPDDAPILGMMDLKVIKLPFGYELILRRKITPKDFEWSDKKTLRRIK